MGELASIRSPLIREVRGRGLYIGIEIDPHRLPARQVVDRLLARGILSKDTHGTVVRIAPPLNVAQEDLAWAVGQLREVLRELELDN
jgi:ornithine--oxo-acid transaminase